MKIQKKMILGGRWSLVLVLVLVLNLNRKFDFRFPAIKLRCYMKPHMKPRH
jgi:hypothetical protein